MEEPPEAAKFGDLGAGSSSGGRRGPGGRRSTGLRRRCARRRPRPASRGPCSSSRVAGRSDRGRRHAGRRRLRIEPAEAAPTAGHSNCLGAERHRARRDIARLGSKRRRETPSAGQPVQRHGAPSCSASTTAVRTAPPRCRRARRPSTRSHRPPARSAMRPKTRAAGSKCPPDDPVVLDAHPASPFHPGLVSQSWSERCVLSGSHSRCNSSTPIANFRSRANLAGGCLAGAYRLCSAPSFVEYQC